MRIMCYDYVIVDRPWLSPLPGSAFYEEGCPTHWGSGEVVPSPISFQSRTLRPDLDGFLYSSLKPEDVMRGTRHLPAKKLRSKVFTSFQFYPEFKFKILLIV